MHSSKDKKLDSTGVESLKGTAHNIVTVPVPKSHVIDEYQPGKIRDNRGVRYSEVQRTFIDSDTAKGQAETTKNSRFKIHELTRKTLSVEKEEEARVQVEVQRRLDEQLAGLRETAIKEAYEKGFEQGKVDGLAAMKESAKPTLENFEVLVKNFEGLRHDVFKANEDLLIRMVYWMVRMITLKELKEDKDYTRRLILQLLERLGTRENIKIFVSSEVYSAAEQLKADLAQTLGSLKNISIDLDPSIQDAGCRIETDLGEVDAQIDVQLQNIVGALEVKT